ncbi:MAG: hypothetical protein ABSH20_09870 [Tepidisphaeraceae bacterium]
MKRLGEWHPAGQMDLEQRRRVCLQRQGVLSPALGVPGFDRDGGRVAFKRKARARQAPKLARPQPGFDGNPIQQRPGLAGHTEPIRGALGRVDQPLHFIGSKLPPIMPPIRLDVQSVQVRRFPPQ